MHELRLNNRSSIQADPIWSDLVRSWIDKHPYKTKFHCSLLCFYKSFSPSKTLYQKDWETLHSLPLATHGNYQTLQSKSTTKQVNVTHAKNKNIFLFLYFLFFFLFYSFFLVKSSKNLNNIILGRANPTNLTLQPKNTSSTCFLQQLH